MSGLDFMEAILDGRLPQPPIARLMGYRLHEVAPGRVVFRGVPEFDVANPMGTVHGGWYGTLLDSAMACAVMTRVPRGSVYTTLEYKVNVIRPIPLGTEIAATGTTSHAGRSTGVAEGRIEGVADGRLYATGSTTCIIMQAG
ncbi:thioesterase [Maritimibacter sp. 55A14]|uniref:PaaI family thioesterase n=1 Tax=Maritimibacter sp. 55A14 TaxID=2174844 RepID=UPI000D62012C|nr:PaaI family thioesterase [Maritimibacter sp. 55A14]PWE32073.1 thioesterase [Maritimibacter sp. 55A14]